MTELKRESVDDILTKRQPAAKRIVSVLEELERVENTLKNIVNYGTDDGSKLTDEQRASIAALPVGSVLQKINTIKKDLVRLQARFCRETLNIGVIGRARQGKSRLLQSLTGLSRREIPDGEGTHCTGVRCIICHRPGTETYGEVIFYDEQSFLSEVIQPYFIELGLGAPPQNIDEFAAKKLNLEDHENTAGKFSKFEHLKKYQRCLPEYRDLIGRKMQRIEHKDIPKYVTQYDPDNNSPYNYYMAVREVRIFCQFPKEEVGKIAVVDMPGLGDTGVGDEERMVRALSEDIDFILFVRMPKHTGDHWADVDVKLYDIVNRASQGTSLETWSFQIINELADGRNRRNCEDLRNTINQHHLRVAKTIIVNCADPRAVQTSVLEPALEHIARYITVLDRRFILASEDRLNELKESLVALAQEAANLISASSVGAKDYSVFSNLFDYFWNERLTLDLENLRIDLWKNRQAADANLKDAMEKACQEAKKQTGIPPIDEIRKKCLQKGSINKAYYDLLDVVRTTLTEKFQNQLDESLKCSVDKLKNAIADIFARAGLAPLSEEGGVSLLTEILKLLETNPDFAIDRGMQKIHQGFKGLTSFMLYYRGLVQPRIRRHLDYLTAPREGISGDRCAPNLGLNPSADLIYEMLQTLHSEALYRIKEELEDLIWEPSMSAFAIAEEFIDCVLRAEGVEKSWRSFLWDHRHKIWHNEFKWQSLIMSLKDHSTSMTLSLL